MLSHNGFRIAEAVSAALLVGLSIVVFSWTARHLGAFKMLPLAVPPAMAITNTFRNGLKARRLSSLVVHAAIFWGGVALAVSLLSIGRVAGLGHDSTLAGIATGSGALFVLGTSMGSAGAMFVAWLRKA